MPTQVWNYPQLPSVLYEGDTGYCVDYAKALTGLSYKGNAIEWAKYINSKNPTLGSTVVFNIGRYGHLGVVVEIESDRFKITERNYNGLFMVNERWVNNDDPSIMGYVDINPLF